MQGIQMNQFKMQNASFSGTDEEGKPFQIRAEIAYQTYESSEKIILERVWGNIERTQDGKSIRDIITADSAIFDKSKSTLNLKTNVRVNSSNGDKILTDEMVVKL